jgi:hypothetical protein
MAVTNEKCCGVVVFAGFKKRSSIARKPLTYNGQTLDDDGQKMMLVVTEKHVNQRDDCETDD